MQRCPNRPSQAQSAVFRVTRGVSSAGHGSAAAGAEISLLFHRFVKVTVATAAQFVEVHSNVAPVTVGVQLIASSAAVAVSICSFVIASICFCTLRNEAWIKSSPHHPPPTLQTRRALRLENCLAHLAVW